MLSAVGDFDGDGVADLAAGAPYFDAPGARRFRAPRSCSTARSSRAASTAARSRPGRRRCPELAASGLAFRGAPGEASEAEAGGFVDDRWRSRERADDSPRGIAVGAKSMGSSRRARSSLELQRHTLTSSRRPLRRRASSRSSRAASFRPAARARCARAASRPSRAAGSAAPHGSPNIAGGRPAAALRSGEVDFAAQDGGEEGGAPLADAAPRGRSVGAIGQRGRSLEPPKSSSIARPQIGRYGAASS